ncbi:MAG: DUF4080 domain-containing protein [Clostridiaceae bacterium]|nr:DUF4080 domain-containing protein [Clostridiaceae bacterium]
MNGNSAQSVGLRIVLCTLNSKFSHTSLALRLLREACSPIITENDELIMAEYTINDQPQQLLQRLYELQGDVYAFSCYIWNSQLTRRLIRELGILKPNAVIILGGPEAAWQQESLMQELPEVDYILAGEGEINLPSLLAGLTAGRKPDEICSELSGVSWRDSSGKTCHNLVNLFDLNADWPFAYSDDELNQLNERILYYESSRGCPFGCTYCMSSRDRRVRYRKLDQVFAELDRFIAADVKLVKFVDRTFNCDPSRALAIWQYLIERSIQTGCRTRFHFEIAADLLDEEAIELLAKVPEGLFQFEIGVQSCSREVLRLINRSCNLDKLFLRSRQLRSSGLIHLHLDLIAGLPGDDLEQMAASFDQIMTLSPHMLQLGFLKVLPGSIMREQALERGMLWRADPPYEIMQSDGMSFDDLLLQKRIENQLDQYYNNDSFTLTISYLLLMSDSAFSLFAALAEVYKQQGWENLAPGRHAVWELPLKLLATDAADSCFSQNKPNSDLLRDCLILDYISSGQKDQPSWQQAMELSQTENDRNAAILIRERNRQEFSGMRRIRVEKFYCDPSGLLNIRKLINRHGLRFVQEMLQEESDVSLERDESAQAVLNRLLSPSENRQNSWLAVFDMSAPKPELIWQIQSDQDIQTAEIIRRCFSYNGYGE